MTLKFNTSDLMRQVEKNPDAFRAVLEDGVGQTLPNLMGIVPERLSTTASIDELAHSLGPQGHMATRIRKYVLGEHRDTEHSLNLRSNQALVIWENHENRSPGTAVLVYDVPSMGRIQLVHQETYNQ